MGNIINDILIRIKNAYLARHNSVKVPYSVFGEQLIKFLGQKGYVEGVNQSTNMTKRFLEVDLKYNGRKPAMSNVKQISKPGLRRYLKVKEMDRFRKSGQSLVILWTPQGLMNLEEARKKNIGGELLAEVW